MNLQTKLISALNASFAVTLAYLLCIYLGMGDDATTAATTVMLIATAENFRSSLQRGFYRVLGTLLGGVAGMALIALFPQDRMLYLFLLSVFATFFLYLARAYRGDKTVFMLTAVTMMMVFQEGQVDDVFLYGANRVVMTIFGIVIYTAVVLYLFPQKIKKRQIKQEQKAQFIWFDIEDIKASLVTFLIFWAGVYVWVVYHPPQGFYVVALATALSLYTTFSLISSMVLIILFSVSFIFATFSYIFILPNLHTAWELGIFLFLYSFLGFYFLNPKISIFFLLGLATFLIDNEMVYNFQIFMIVLLIFYMFLFLLLLFDYIPFNAKPQAMFLRLTQRYFTFVKSILEQNYLFPYAKRFLSITLEKMQLYMAAIDFKYYNELSKDELAAFVRECQQLCESLEIHMASGNKVPPKTLLLQYRKLSSKKFDILKESKF